MATMTFAAGPPIADRISDQEFDAVRRLVYDRFGINLTDQKRILVVGRLQSVLRQRGFVDFGAYLDWLAADRSGAGLEELANRISTNHTFFYREKAHFEHFVSVVLPAAIARRQAAGDLTLRVWCAGCSTGEEPYTLMMLMMQYLGTLRGDWRATLVATDISGTALETARTGEYPVERVEPLPEPLRRRYFEAAPSGERRVVDEVRRNIEFRRHNLMDATFPFNQPFDAVFCRNVMIYFDQDTRNRLVAKFHRHTTAGGHLFIGHAETLRCTNSDWQYVLPAVYVRNS